MEANIMTSQQVADMFKVSQRSVTTWANKGIIPSFRTPGGHLRFRMKDVEQFTLVKEADAETF